MSTFSRRVSGESACRRARRSSRRRPARSAWHISPTTSPGSACSTSAARPSTSVAYDGTSVDADPRGAGAHQPVELLDRAAAQVALLVRDRDARRQSRAPISPSLSISSSVRSPTAPRPSSSRRAGAAYAVHDLEQRLETGLVVGEVDDHGRPSPTEKMFIRPGLCSASGQEGAQPLDHDVARDADRQRGARPRRGRSRR